MSDGDDHAEGSHATRSAKLYQMLGIKPEAGTQEGKPKAEIQSPVASTEYSYASGMFHTAKHEPETSLVPDAVPSVASGGSELPALSADEQLMMNAMQNRSKEKAEEKAMKRPSSAAVCKRPASAIASGKHVKRDVAEYQNKCKLPMLSDHGSVKYRGGKIYCIWGHNKYRTIKDLQRPSQEKQAKWSSDKPSKAEWDEAVTAIDEYWDSKKKAPTQKKKKTSKK